MSDNVKWGLELVQEEGRRHGATMDNKRDHTLSLYYTECAPSFMWQMLHRGQIAAQTWHSRNTHQPSFSSKQNLCPLLYKTSTCVLQNGFTYKMCLVWEWWSMPGFVRLMVSTAHLTSPLQTPDSGPAVDSVDCRPDSRTLLPQTQLGTEQGWGGEVKGGSDGPEIHRMHLVFLQHKHMKLGNDMEDTSLPAAEGVLQYSDIGCWWWVLRLCCV